MKYGIGRTEPALASVALVLLAMAGAYGGATLLAPARLPAHTNHESTVRLATWNVENLFDANYDGTEFDSFDPRRDSWNEAKYLVKLDNTAEVIRALDPDGVDILVLQEIEHRAALADLVQRISDVGFRYSHIVDESGGPFHNAVLSRFPVTAARTHALSMPWTAAGRYILEVDIQLENDRNLVVLINHWHSKRSGSEQTEPARQVAAAAVARRVRERSKEAASAVVVAGDLNSSADEYLRRSAAYPTALLPAEAAGRYSNRDALFLTDTIEKAGVRSDGGAGGAVVLYSPWKAGAQPGSYVFRDEWKSLDHILFGPGFGADRLLEKESFRVVAEPFMIDSRGAPLRWRSDAATGYSDHLPLVAEFSPAGEIPPAGQIPPVGVAD